MANITMRITVAHRPPFVFVANSSGQPYFSGMLMDLLNKIVVTSTERISYSIYVSPSNAGGSVDSSGKWSGVIGELVEGRADVALFPLTRTAARLKAIDCTFSYLDQGLGLIVRDDMASPGPLSVLAPFAMTLWVTLLCTVIGIAMLFWLLDVYGRWIRARQTEALRVQGVLTEKQIARAKKDDRSPVLISFMAAAGAPERPNRTSWGVQVLYVVYCFFCLIVLSAYTANLTSYLAVRRATVGISGLQDIARDNGHIGVNPNGSTASYFANSRDTQATQLQPYVRYCATDTCLAWLRAGIVQAFVSDMPALEYLEGQQPCDLTTVGDPFGPGNLVVGLAKNSSLMPLFNNAIQGFTEDGTLTSLQRAWFEGLSQCDKNLSELDNSRLTIGQMLGAFVFLLAGVVIAFITGTVENLKWCLARAYRSYNESENGRSLSSRLRTNTWRRISTMMALAGERAGSHDRMVPPADVSVRRGPKEPPSQPHDPGAVLLQQQQPSMLGGGAAAGTPPAGDRPQPAPAFSLYAVVQAQAAQQDRFPAAGAAAASVPDSVASGVPDVPYVKGSSLPTRADSSGTLTTTGSNASRASTLKELQLLPMMPVIDTGAHQKLVAIPRQPSRNLSPAPKRAPLPSPLQRVASARTEPGAPRSCSCTGAVQEPLAVWPSAASLQLQELDTYGDEGGAGGQGGPVPNRWASRRSEDRSSAPPPPPPVLAASPDTDCVSPMAPLGASPRVTPSTKTLRVPSPHQASSPQQVSSPRHVPSQQQASSPHQVPAPAT